MLMIKLKLNVTSEFGGQLTKISLFSHEVSERTVHDITNKKHQQHFINPLNLNFILCTSETQKLGKRNIVIFLPKKKPCALRSKCTYTMSYNSVQINNIYTVLSHSATWTVTSPPLPSPCCSSCSTLCFRAEQALFTHSTSPSSWSAGSGSELATRE